MSKLTLFQKAGLVVAAFALIFGLALIPAQAFAAPVADNSATNQTTDKIQQCEVRKDNAIDRLQKKIDQVKSRIDQLKDRIQKAKNDKVKAKLEKALDKAQTHLAKLQDKLTKVQAIDCTRKGTGKSTATPTPAPTN